MKLKSFCMLGVAALLLASCNKEQEKVALQGEKNATISVRVGNATTRIAEDRTLESKISDLHVMVYNGDLQEGYGSVSSGALEVTNVECEAGNRKLVVVGNYNDTGLPSLEGMTLSALEATILDLNKVAAEGDKMLMTTEIKDIVLKEGNNFYGSAGAGNVIESDPLPITRINARMELKDVAINLNPQFEVKYSVVPKKVIGLIAKKGSKLFTASATAVEESYYYGAQTFEDAEKGAAGFYTPANYEMLPALSIDYVQAKLDKTMGFYVFENDNQEHPTILCLVADLKQKDGGDLSAEEKQKAFNAGWIVSPTDATTYYPILVNWDKDKYSYEGGHNADNKIKRNNNYKISLTITGPGTNKPEKPKKLSYLDVTCEVAPWVVVEQKVVW